MRNQEKSQLLKFMIIGIVIGALMFGGTLLYSQNFNSIEGYVDALTMSTFILFVLGWFIYISNEGTLDILIYGVQAFAKAIVGKKMKDSYYDYTTGKHHVSKDTYRGFWLAALIYLVAFIVLYIIYKSK